MENEDEHSYEDIDSQVYNNIDDDEILNEPQTDEQRSAGTTPVASGHHIADPLGNAMHDPGPSQHKDGDSIITNIWGRLKSYKCPRPSLLRVIAITMPVVALLGIGACVLMYLTFTENKAWLATTLPDNTTELSQMTDTQPDQSTSLPGFPLQYQKETALLTTEGHLPFGRSPPFHGNTFANAIHVPRCNNGYRLLVGTCIKLVVPTGWLGIPIGKSHDEAKKTCKNEGATLAMPKTEELDVTLRDLVKTEGGNKGYWIGMEEKDGTWYWVDGSKVGNNGYTGWNPDEPSNNSRWLGTLCGQYWEKVSSWLFSQSGYPMWDDEACFNLRRFICQRPPA
ncbi:hypothetical protein Bbelb_055310 [Branchiostoma belcheri]|nr:hypothetical protein Bbelb_055310 [Branchiostoma belcheri]